MRFLSAPIRPRAISPRWSSKTREDTGSMTLALLFIVLMGMLAVVAVASVTWQSAHSENRSKQLDLQWTMDSARAAAAQQIGIQGRTLLGLSTGQSMPWQTGPVPNSRYKYWVVSQADAVATLTALDPSHVWTSAYDPSTTLRVAINETGQTYTSNNGTNWAAGGTLDPGTYTVKYALSKWVAVRTGAPGKAYVSPDGTTWAPIAALGSSTTFRDLACSPTACIFMTSAGDSITTDLSAVTALTGTPADSTDVHIAYADGTWLATGPTTSLWRSTNGTTWAKITDPSPFGELVAYVNGTWVAASKSTSGERISTDGGVTWQAAALPAVGPWSALVPTDGGLALIPSGQSTNYWLTVNGKQWVPQTLPGTAAWGPVSATRGGWLFSRAGAATVELTAPDPGHVGTVPSAVVVTEARINSDQTDPVDLLSVLTFTWDEPTARWKISGYQPANTSAPSTLSALSAPAVTANSTSGGFVELTWAPSQPVPAGTKWMVYRSDSSAPLFVGTGTMFADGTVTTKHQYTYRVYAVSGDIWSPAGEATVVSK